MKPVRLHPRVYDDIDEALAYTREQLGARQVVLYARLISKGRQGDSSDVPRGFCGFPRSDCSLKDRASYGTIL
jgi:hypothetical protein